MFRKHFPRVRDSGNHVNKLRDSGIYEKLVRDSGSRSPLPDPDHWPVQKSCQKQSNSITLAALDSDLSSDIEQLGREV